MASSRAPIEIWAQILEFTFEFSLVVDKLPFTPSFWLSASEYWSTERQRCILRLVCSSWRNCVDRRTHRLLHMWDFVRYELPDECLLKAERITFNFPHRCGSWVPHCDCSTRMIWLTDVGAEDRNHFSKWKSVHLELFLTRFIELKAQCSETLVVQALDMSEIVLEDAAFIAELGQKLDLLSLAVHFLTEAHIFQSMFTAFHQLAHLAIFFEDIFHEQPHLPNITLPHLRSFASGASYHYLDSLGLPSWNLPKLEVICLGVEFETHEDMRALTKSFGNHLKSIQCDRLGQEFVIDEAMWHHFPALESTSWLPFILNPNVPPPQGHPLSTLLIYPPTFANYHINITDIKEWLAEAPFIGTVQFAVPWSGFHYFKGPVGGNEFTWATEIEVWISNGIVVLDNNDVPWGSKTADVRVRNPPRHG